MAKSGRPRIGEKKMNKIVPIKIDREHFEELRDTQQLAKDLVKKGDRNKGDLEELATTLRSSLYEYIEKLKDFVANGTSMKEDNVDAI